MLSALNTLQFAQLGMLGLGVLIPLLVLAYLRRSPKKRQIVSSTLLLSHLPRHVVIRKRIRLPLRFFLELLALILITLAAADPFIRFQGERVAVILDNSLSMSGAVSGREPRITRLEQARERLTRALESRSVSDQYTLYQSAPRSIVVGEKNSSASDLERNAKTVLPALTSDSLPALVAELKRAAEYDQIIIFTDRELASSVSGGNHGTAVEVVTVGGPASNWCVADLRLERGDVQDPSGKIVGTVGYSGESPNPVTVILSSRASSPDAAGRELSRKTVELRPGADTEVVFPLDQFPSERTFRLALEAAPKANGENAITADDFGFVARDSSGGMSLLLVSSEITTRGSLGIDSIPGVTVSPLTPEEYLGLSPSQLNQYSAVVFHRVAPRSTPGIPSLLILPPNNNVVFPARAEVQRPKISSWLNEHPITQYLRVPLLDPARAIIFDVPPWAQGVVNVEQGCLIVAGESKGIRFVGVGLELLPFEGMRSPVFSILTLNTISWLTAGSNLAGGFVTGSSVRLEAGKSWVSQVPSGEITPVASEATESFFYPLEKSGIYELAGGSVETGDRRVKVRKTVAANVFYPDESDTFVVHPLELQSEAGTATDSLRSLSPVWPFLVTAVLVLLMLEYLLRFIEREASA